MIKLVGEKGRCCAYPGLENQVENLSLVLSENILPKYVRYRCAVTPENKYFTEKYDLRETAVCGLKRSYFPAPRN